MDEPFSALDPLIRRQLQGEFMKLAAQMKKTTVFITHDLDEAARIGNRIAIMRDGRIIQIGTAEEIVLKPAVAYVAEFVAGISRLALVKAHSVMQPVAEYEQHHGPIPDNATSANDDTPLNELIKVAVNNNGVIRIADRDSKTIGVVTKNDLLLGVISGSAA